MVASIRMGYGGNANGNTDGDALRSLVKFHTYTAVVAAVADFTDNSGGTPDSTTYALEAIPAVTSYDSAGTDLAAKAEFELSLVDIKNALKTISTRVNAALTAAGLATVTYSAAGTDGAGTIAAIDVDMTAVAADGVDVDGANTAITLFARILKTLALDVNRACKACGVDEIDVSLVTQTSGSASYAAAASTDTGTAVTVASVEETDAEATLVAFANNISTLAAKMDILTGGTPALDVVVVD